MGFEVKAEVGTDGAQDFVERLFHQGWTADPHFLGVLLLQVLADELFIPLRSFLVSESRVQHERTYVRSHFSFLHLFVEKFHQFEGNGVLSALEADEELK